MLDKQENLDLFLEKRGIASVEALDIQKEDIPSVLLLNGAQDFIDRVVEEIKTGQRITVVGDYDADGICGTTVALRSVRLIANALGIKAKVNYVVPHRFHDGYGLSRNLVDKAILQNPKTNVLITVDNGIVANEAIDYAHMRGLRVYITDHHQGQLPVPNADVIVNPNAIDDPYPFKGISGATVIWKLFLEMAHQYAPEAIPGIEALVDFVGISAVADMMPVLEENRYYINEAVAIFNGESDHPTRFSWLALIEYLNHIKKLPIDYTFTEKDFGFTIGPILNAQSRVEGAADIAIDLFESKSTEDIREKIEYMVSINEHRKKLSNESFDRIDKDQYENDSVIVIRDDNLGEGFIGLVAGKITEHFQRPSVVFTSSKEGLKGSARSVEGIDLLTLLKGVDPSIYVKMGGHAQAAGMTIHEDRLEDFTSELMALGDQVVDLNREIVLDYDFEVDAITEAEVHSLYQYRPYGIGFEPPIIRLNETEIMTVSTMGKEKQHLKIKTEPVDIVSWNAPETLMDRAEQSDRIAVIGEVSINEFMGSKTIQMIADERQIELS